MNNPQKERAEAKLKLWDTPGFSQFLHDLAVYMDNSTLITFSEVLRKQYKAKLEEEKTKFKQGNLGL